jgi:hypothetical protein
MTTTSDAQSFNTAFETVNRAEDAILANLSDGVRATLHNGRAMRYNYLHAAQRLEVDTTRAALAMGALADDPSQPELCRSIAHSRAAELWTLATRHGEAWLFYESIQHLPIQTIVWQMCEAGFGDHALYLCGGVWAAEDEDVEVEEAELIAA